MGYFYSSTILPPSKLSLATLISSHLIFYPFPHTFISCYHPCIYPTLPSTKPSTPIHLSHNPYLISSLGQLSNTHPQPTTVPIVIVESSQLVLPPSSCNAPIIRSKEMQRRQHMSRYHQTSKDKCSLVIIIACQNTPFLLIHSSQPHAFVAEFQTFNAASLACTLFITSGSGAGSTLAGAARGQDSHFGCWQRTHSGRAASAAALPSSESGCGTGG